MTKYKKIKGFENYKVSNKGNVVKSNEYGLKVPVRFYKTKDGYYTVKLYKNGKRFTKSVHRLVAGAFLRNRRKLPIVHHKNSIKTDNRSSNLLWSTHSDNLKESYRSYCRLRPVGVFNPNHVLNETNVHMLRKMIKEGIAVNTVADYFNISSDHTSKISNRKYWTHVS